MLKMITVRKNLFVAGIEIVIFLACALFSVLTYTKTEIVFTDEEMQLQDMSRNYVRGVFGYIL